MKKILFIALAIITMILVVACTNKAQGQVGQPTQQPTEQIDPNKYEQLLGLSEKLIQQIIEKNVPEETIQEMQEAGFSQESINAVENSIKLPESKYKDGIYTGVGQAHNGKITVEATIYDGKIIYFQVLDHKETAPALSEVFNTIPVNILKKQSTQEVDVVSGATESSNGYLAAVENALSQAK